MLYFTLCSLLQGDHARYYPCMSQYHTSFLWNHLSVSSLLHWHQLEDPDLFISVLVSGWWTRQLWDKFMMAAPTIPSAKLHSVAMPCPQVLLVCLPGLSQISELSRFKQKFSSLCFFLFHLRQKWFRVCVCACECVCVPNKPKMMSEVFLATESFFQLKVLIHVFCCPFSNYSVTTLL